MQHRNRKAATEQRKKWQTIALFLAKFFAVYLVLQSLLLATDLSFLENALASLEANWLRETVVGSKIILKTGIFYINAQCTGLVSGIILAAVVFSLKKPGWKQKVELWLLGAVVLFILNIGRVFLVLLVAQQHGFYWAEIVHEISWFSTAIFILGIWLLLSKRIAKVKSVSELVE